ncbi:RTX toxin [Proteus hauseri]|nr:RTX toxin [Proteus hauseri]
MNGFKKVNFKESINSVALKIEQHIKENCTELFCTFESIKQMITENYISLLIDKNEYVANELLIKIEKNLSLYNQNEFTKNIDIVRKKINSNIERLFLNSMRLRNIKSIQIKGERLTSLASHNQSGIYYINIDDQCFFLQIDNVNCVFKFIDFNGEAEFFYSKDALINRIDSIIKTDYENNIISYRFYHNNEHLSFYSINDLFNANNKNIINGIINDIKEKKQIYINDNISIELNESYSYKNIFIIRDKIEKSEKVLHIYNNDIEESFTIAKSRYNQIKENGEYLFYKLGTEWLVSNIINNDELFSQETDLLKPLEKIIEQIKLISSSESNYNFMGDPKNGLCYGLSLNYLLEVRSNGLEGGTKYLNWLKENAYAYVNKNKKIYNDFDMLLFNNVRKNETINYIKEVKSIIFSQYFQMVGKKTQDDYFISDSLGVTKYSEWLYDLGLDKLDFSYVGLEKENIFNKINSIMKENNKYYAVILLKDHAISITYTKYSNDNYRFSIFNPNYGVTEYNDVKILMDILYYHLDFYGGHEIDNGNYFIFNEFKESEIKTHKSLWNSNPIDTNKNIAENIKKAGFSLHFNENIIGRVVHYSEKGDLIVELKQDNKITEVIVKDIYIDDGLYLLKNNINKIIENNNASKIIVKKTEDNDVSINIIEFNTHQKIKNAAGYIEFDDIYYRELIDINRFLLKGKKANELNEIASLIDILKGNIYFDKIMASFSLINKIKYFNHNSHGSLFEILNKVKDKLEGKLFYDKLIYGKEKILSLSESNNLVAAKLYQLMVSEISDNNYGISNFIYSQVIESPYLLLDKNKSAGIEGYDYTITFKQNNQELHNIVESIDIPELKNTILIESLNTLHLKYNYQRLSEYKNNESVDKLVSVIENEIDLKRGESSDSYRDLYFDLFINNRFKNRMIVHDIEQLEYYFNNNLRERNYGYHYYNFYIDEANPGALLEKSFNKNKNEIDCSYILFDENESNFKFLFNDNKFFTARNISKIIVDNINSYYQDDILIYFYNGIKSEKLSSYLKNKPEVSNFLDYCLKNKIRLVATGNEDNEFLHQDFIKHKNKIDYLHNIILENQYSNEKTIVFAKKEKLLSHRYGHLFIEGLAQRLNMPIYQVVDNKLSLLNENFVIKPLTVQHYINKPLLENSTEMDIIIPEADNASDRLKNNKINIEEDNYTNKIYKLASDIFSNFRDDDKFILGYKENITTAISSYSEKMTMADIFNYIKLNRYSLNDYQIGTIINKVDQLNIERHKKVLKNISDIIINNNVSIKVLCNKYFYELSAFFMTSDKKNITNKLYQVIYDPLISEKFNQYLMNEITIEEWKSYNQLTEEKLTLVEKTNQTIKLVHSIYDNPKIIGKLSLLSNNLLSSFFDINNKGVLYHVLLNFISTFENYKNIINKLGKIIFMNKNNLILDTLSPVKALDKVSTLENSTTLDINKKLIYDEVVEINKTYINKGLLISLGAKIDGVNIDNVDLNNMEQWELKLKFDPHHLNDYFLSASDNENDKKVIALFNYLLNGKKDKIKHLISNDSNRMDYLAASERFKKIIDLGNKHYNDKDWNALRQVSLKIPRHMKIISKIGYANITYGMWQSINTTFIFAEQLNNPKLTTKERKDIINNLAIMWSEIASNGLSEVIEIALAKGLLKYRHNPLDYVSKISTRVGIGLNILSVGFDIYNAYDNFSRIAGESNEKRKVDYIVNGSFAIVSGLVTLGVSIAMLAGSVIAGPIGVVAGAVIALATSIYNAARLIEEAKTKVHFTPLEELDNGFYAFLMGDLLPSKKNEIIYLETETQLENMIDENAKKYFDKIKKENDLSLYFYTNEKHIYQEYYYYKIIPNLIGRSLDSILNPLGEYISERISQNIPQKEAEEIAALSYYLRAEKTEYKYYIPEKAISTDEVLIFDMNFYINELKRYSIDIVSDDESHVFDNIVSNDFLNEIITSKEKTVKTLSQSELLGDLIKVNNYNGYYLSNFKNNETLYFNSYNGDDIIAAPAITKNNFDIYNGTKRLSGGNNDDMFNLLASESPNYASRFYGRGGNDTLHIIKTTNKYAGYEIDLSKNYVKFKKSENVNNSQNFNSKLFLYQDNGRVYSRKLLDTMPSIVLQAHKVIAYLDSIENVIGSKNSNDIIYGNQNDNYLDGVDGTDLLYGLKGNDTLALQDGYAEGGDGNDKYIILRASLEKSYNILFETIINEVSKSESSVVKLNYNFDEITSINRYGKDIVFNIKVNDGNKENKLIYHSVTLRNVYDSNQGNILSHQYMLTTMDGFMLTINESKNITDNVLYNFSYLDTYANDTDKIQSIHIDENNESLFLSYANKNKTIKLLSKIKYSGFSSGEGLRFGIDSNKEDNNYFSITADSFIKLSSGHDNYQIKTFLAKNKSDEIKVSLSNSSDDLNKSCVSNFFLSDVSGFDLIFNNGILSHRYHPDAYLKIIFDKLNLKYFLDSNANIRFIDKDNTIFTLPIKESQQGLLMPVTNLNLTMSNEDDVLMIPESLILNKAVLSAYSIYTPESHFMPISLILKDNKNKSVDLLPILELMDGDDIVVNHNKSSSVIDGGNGDDHIVVNGGHHILIAGEGNDNINAGSGNDLLISQSGHDYLNGGAGNNIYIVQKRQGNVTVYDEGENSHLFITGLSEQDTFTYSEIGDDMQYRSQDNQFTLTVKTKENNNSSVILIEKQNTFSMQSLASIIQDMAQFNEQQLTTMQGSEFIPSSTWSPLTLVTKHL